MERLAWEARLKTLGHNGFRPCMDPFREHQMLDRLWVEEKAPWKTW